jgi:hypothetical protein
MLDHGSGANIAVDGISLALDAKAMFVLFRKIDSSILMSGYWPEMLHSSLSIPSFRRWIQEPRFENPPANLALSDSQTDELHGGSQRCEGVLGMNYINLTEFQMGSVPGERRWQMTITHNGVDAISRAFSE